jgi:hypothetical protein
VVDWGTVPDWVGGIGTTGALLLGFYILLRDRRKEDRTQAARIIIRAVSTTQGTGRMVRILNKSDRPIFFPSMQYGSGRWRRDPFGYISFRAASDTGDARTFVSTLEPDHEAWAEVIRRVDPRKEWFDAVFQDAAGKDWRYDLVSRRLRRGKPRMGNALTDL